MSGGCHDGVAGGCGARWEGVPHPPSSCAAGTCLAQPLLRLLLPAAAEVVEVAGDVAEAAACAAAQEVAAIAGARPGRRAEFLTGRWCARVALGRLGVPAAAVLPGVRRAPVWPPGVVGSITHCPGYRAAAVARRGDVAALGVDATPHAPLPARVLEALVVPGEQEALARAAEALPGVHADRVLFSAKESLVKAWSALDPQWRGFAGFRVELAVDGTFSAEVLGTSAALGGRWRVDAGLAATAVTVAADPATTSTGWPVRR